MGLTAKTLRLLDALAREARLASCRSAEGEHAWKAPVYGGPIRGRTRTLRCVAGGAARGDVACLIRLRYIFGLSPTC